MSYFCIMIIPPIATTATNQEVSDSWMHYNREVGDESPTSCGDGVRNESVKHAYIKPRRQGIVNKKAKPPESQGPPPSSIPFD